MSWTFITNHGAVLALVGQHGQITGRDIASELEITERSVMRIIKDLADEGYIVVEREGRSNRYLVNTDAPLRRPEKKEVIIGELLAVLSSEKP